MNFNVESLPDILRLKSLKNVSGRRKVLPGAQYMQDLENFDNEMSETTPPPAVQNLPESDRGGELTPQSYDVRANAITPPEEETRFQKIERMGRELFKNEPPNEEQNQETPYEQLTRLGQALGVQAQETPQEAQVPPIETQQVQAQEGLPPVPPHMQVLQPDNSIWTQIGRALKEYVQPFGTERHTQGKATPENEVMLENARLHAQGIENPEEYKAEQAAEKEMQQETVHAEADEALKNPFTTTVYGATDEVANQPEIQDTFKTYTGMDFTPEIEERTREYEKVMSDIQDQLNEEGSGYNEQEQRIKERILANQATDADKFYVGLALLMPLLVGAFFGKEAGLGALSGTAKGLSEVMGNRSKETLKNEELLADIGAKKGANVLKKAELDLKRLALPSDIKKGLPEDEKKFLKGKKVGVWVNPETGEEEETVKITPDLVARAQFAANADELKEMRNQAREIAPAVNATKEINKLTGEIVDVASKMKDKNIVQQAFQSYLSGKSPGFATKTGEMVEVDGRKVNAYVFLEHKIKLLVDAYRQAKGMRALTETVQNHIEGLFRNPAASFQSYQDTIDQMLYTRDLAQDRIMNNVTESGFVPDYVAKALQPEVRKTFNTLNRREGEKESTALLRE
jgi:hypothetical protein